MWIDKQKPSTLLNDNGNLKLTKEISKKDSCFAIIKFSGYAYWVLSSSLWCGIAKWFLIILRRKRSDQPSRNLIQTKSSNGLLSRRNVLNKINSERNTPSSLDP